MSKKEPEKYDDQNRLIRFRTRQGRGVLIYRLHDKRNGKKVYRDYFTFAVKRDGKRYYFSLSGEKEKAAKKADEIDGFLKSHTIEEALAKYSPSKRNPHPSEERRSPTVGELIATYLQVANSVTDRTKKEVACALRRIAAHIQELKVFRQSVPKIDLQEWRAKVDSLNVSAFTYQALETFKGDLIRSAGTDETARARAAVTANTIIRNARCIFSPKMRRLYESFQLPDPCPFAMVGKMEERPHRYVSRVEIGKLVKDARKELAHERKSEFVVFVLSLFAGLRRGEIDRLTWEQVDFEEGHIWIKTTPYFRPKARNSESRVDCPKEVFEVLREFKEECGEGPFVLPGGDAKSQVRCRPLFRSLTEWLQDKGIKEQKPLHTLRKEAGSSIFMLTGSADRAAEFLRNDPKTAREYYLGRKGRLEVEIEGL